MADECELLCLNLDIAEDLRRKAKSARTLEASARIHAALSDELRLAMLVSLQGHELCGCDLAWIHERSQSLVSHHMKTLLNAGLVSSRREGKVVFFALTSLGVTHLPTASEQVQI